MTEVW